MTLADAILEIAKLLPGVANLLSSEREKEQERFTKFVDSIIDCLTRIANGLEKRNVPHEACTELSAYCAEFSYSMAGVPGQYSELANRVAPLDSITARMASIPNQLSEALDRLGEDPRYCAAQEDGVGPGASLWVLDVTEEEINAGVRQIREAIGKLRALSVLIRQRLP